MLVKSACNKRRLRFHPLDRDPYRYDITKSLAARLPTQRFPLSSPVLFLSCEKERKKGEKKRIPSLTERGTVPHLHDKKRKRRESKETEAEQRRNPPQAFKEIHTKQNVSIHSFVLSSFIILNNSLSPTKYLQYLHPNSPTYIQHTAGLQFPGEVRRIRELETEIVA